MDLLTGWLSKDGMLFVTIIFFIIGLAMIIKGGDFFVDAASWMGEVTGIPKLIIGATIVSFATTLPELLVSIFATMQGSIGMATGNAIGSVTANIGLIMALSIIFMPVVVERKEIKLKTILMLSPLFIMFIFGILYNGSFKGDGMINIWCALILFGIFAYFMFDNIQHAVKDVKLEAKLTEENKRPKPTQKEVVKNIVLFVVGAVFIVFGAEFLVETATIIATKLNVPEAVIGLTIVAVGTSLPELVTTITAIVKKESSLSVGNIIGANIIDLTMILSICSFVGGGNLALYEQNILLDIPVCFLFGSIALIPTLINKKFNRWQGFLLLGLYVIYVLLLTFGVNLIGIVPAPN